MFYLSAALVGLSQQAILLYFLSYCFLRLLLCFAESWR